MRIAARRLFTNLRKEAAGIPCCLLTPGMVNVNFQSPQVCDKQGRGTQTSPPILSVNSIWVQLWLSFLPGTHTRIPDAFLKVAVLCKKLPRTGSPSPMTLRLLFLGGFRFLVYQERKTMVLPDASLGTKLQEAIGLVQGKPTHITSPMLVFPSHSPKEKLTANLSFSLQGFAITSVPQPTAAPISQPRFQRHLLKPHCSTDTTGSQQLL